jgi:16S rRNA processing protein RimM
MPAHGAARERWVTLGRVSGIFGVRGWVRVFSFCEPRTGILEYPRWWLGPEGERREYTLIEGRAQGAGVVAKLEGVEDRDSARARMDLPIAVPRDALAESEEYYWTDLIGLAVENRDAVKLGRITGFMATGGHDVMVVAEEVANKRRERLIPWAPGVYVDRVALQEGRVFVDWHTDD